MPSAQRQLGATPAEVWDVVGDPHHLPRWLPRVARVEAVSAAGFTQVMPARRGRQVRLDFSIVESVPGQRAAWTQELAGTPFERLLSEWTTTVELAPDGAGDGAGCVVTLTERQRLRGSWRLGAPFQRRPARVRWKVALDGLEALFPSR